MTQEERWNAKYNEVKAFIETNKRNSSKFIPEERGLRNWVRQNIEGTGTSIHAFMCLKNVCK